MNKVLLITYVKNSHATTQLDDVDEFVAAVNDAGRETDLSSCTVQSLVFEYGKDGCRILLKGIDLKERFDTLLLRNIHCFTDYANALRLYTDANELRLINAKDAQFPYIGKVSQGFLFAYNNIPTPYFVSTLSNEALIQYVNTAPDTDYPLIVKHNEGVKGLRNFLVKDIEELQRALHGQKPGFLAQPFIENTGELRVLTFPDREPLVFSKRSSGETHLNNTARGGQGELLSSKDVPAEILSTAGKIQRLTGRNLGGIDVLLAKDGSWSILEDNHTPALASGMFTDKKAEALAESLQAVAARSKT